MGCGFEGENCREAHLEEEIVRLEAALSESRAALALVVKEMGRVQREAMRRQPPKVT